MDEHSMEIMLPVVHQFEVFAAWYQFYLHDAQADWSRFDWLPEDAAIMVALAPGIVAVCTTRYGFVPVEVIVATEPPADDWAEWDHVAEASINAPSGHLLVTAPTTDERDAGHLIVRSGTYGVRVSLRGLPDPATRPVTDGEDHARVVLWPDAPRKLRVLKQSPWAVAVSKSARP